MAGSDRVRLTMCWWRELLRTQYLQKKTARKGDSSSSRSSMRLLTASISSASSRFSSSDSHSNTESSFFKSPMYIHKSDFLFVCLHILRKNSHVTHSGRAIEIGCSPKNCKRRLHFILGFFFVLFTVVKKTSSDNNFNWL